MGAKMPTNTGVETQVFAFSAQNGKGRMECERASNQLFSFPGLMAELVENLPLVFCGSSAETISGKGAANDRGF